MQSWRGWLVKKQPTKQNLWRWETYNLWLGRHSRIPDCCIAFYIHNWSSQPWKSRERYWLLLRKRAKDIHYIPCPVCLKNQTFIRIHICTARCQVPPHVWAVLPAWQRKLWRQKQARKRRRS